MVSAARRFLLRLVVLVGGGAGAAGRGKAQVHGVLVWLGIGFGVWGHEHAGLEAVGMVIVHSGGMVFRSLGVDGSREALVVFEEWELWWKLLMKLVSW